MRLYRKVEKRVLKVVLSFDEENEWFKFLIAGNKVPKVHNDSRLTQGKPCQTYLHFMIFVVSIRFIKHLKAYSSCNIDTI